MDISLTDKHLTHWWTSHSLIDTSLTDGHLTHWCAPHWWTPHSLMDISLTDGHLTDGYLTWVYCEKIRFLDVIWPFCQSYLYIILYRTGLVDINSLNLSIVGMVFFLHLLWMIVLLYIVDWADICSLLEFVGQFSRLFWLSESPFKKLSVILMGLPLDMTLIFPLQFLISFLCSVSLVFYIFKICCEVLFLFWSFLFSILYASCTL